MLRKSNQETRSIMPTRLLTIIPHSRSMLRFRRVNARARKNGMLAGAAFRSRGSSAAGTASTRISNPTIGPIQRAPSAALSGLIQ